MTIKVLFLTESGNGIGLGHITRVKAIHGFLIQHGIESKIINYVNGDQSSNWIQFPEKHIEYESFNVIFVDSYLTNFETFGILSKFTENLIVLDDYNRLLYPVSVIINPNVYFDRINYSNQKGKCLGGLDYVIIREKFRNAEGIRDFNKGQILISIGGSDYRCLLPKLAKISLAWSNVKIVCPEDSVRAKLKDLFPNLEVYGQLTEEEMLNQIISSEVVISGCGQTLHELNFLNKKTIGILIDEDQKLNQEYYLSNGFLDSKISWNDENLIENIESSIRSNLSRNELSEMKTLQKNNFDPQKNLTNYLHVIKALVISSPDCQ